MILEFSISNFRSIKESQTISFLADSSKHLEDVYVVKIGKYRILKMISLFGANASGKSNLIKGFSLLRSLVLHPAKNRTSKIKYETFYLDEKWEKGDSEIELNFICGEYRYLYYVKFNNQFILEEKLSCQGIEDLRAHKVFDRTTDTEKEFSSIVWGSKYRSSMSGKGLESGLLPNRTIFGAYQTTNVDIPWLKAIVDWFETYMLPNIHPHDQNLTDYISKKTVEKEISQELLIQELQKADIGVSSLTLEVEKRPLPKELVEHILKDDDTPAEIRDRISADPTTTDYNIKLIHNGENGGVAFEFEDESEGTQRYYELSGILLTLVQTPHFLAVDELECRLHPDLYKHFIISFLTNSKTSQLIFTTHLREFLYDSSIYRDDSVWFTEKGAKGDTEVFCLADFDKEVLDPKVNRFFAYRAGRFGAAPVLGDTRINTKEYDSEE
ncbi:MAG: ATP-binding protein [Muribaculaceae bacterium]|nr:ATP-binding protein [Muribaculaceae bacterium]